VAFDHDTDEEREAESGAQILPVSSIKNAAIMRLSAFALLPDLREQDFAFDMRDLDPDDVIRQTTMSDIQGWMRQAAA
jgi:hypothetical protein